MVTPRIIAKFLLLPTASGPAALIMNNQAAVVGRRLSVFAPFCACQSKELKVVI